MNIIFMLFTLRQLGKKWQKISLTNENKLYVPQEKIFPFLYIQGSYNIRIHYLEMFVALRNDPNEIQIGALIIHEGGSKLGQ